MDCGDPVQIIKPEGQVFLSAEPSHWSLLNMGLITPVTAKTPAQLYLMTGARVQTIGDTTETSVRTENKSLLPGLGKDLTSKMPKKAYGILGNW